MRDNNASSERSVRVVVAPSYGRWALRFQGINFCRFETFADDGRVLTSPTYTIVIVRLDRTIQYPGALDYSQASLGYWVARSSRAMTGESVARFLHRHCEERLSAEAHRAKAEATKQSIEPQRKLDCFVARAPRNDDDTCLRDLATRSARAVHETFRPEIQRAQGMPGARCTRSLACK